MNQSTHSLFPKSPPPAFMEQFYKDWIRNTEHKKQSLLQTKIDFCDSNEMFALLETLQHEKKNLKNPNSSYF